jgi:RNA polymerase sigma factor (sigma-70 family)
MAYSQAPTPEPRPRPGPAENPESDREGRLATLLEAARAGHRDGLNEIVAELSPVLWHVARAQGLDRETSQDVIQTAWLRLLDHLAEIQTPRALTAWLITVTRREAWRVHGTSRATPSLDEETIAALPDGDALPDDQVLANERQQLLWNALRQLPHRCQYLLRVIAFTPRPMYSSVASALGMPVGSIGPTRGRCLAKLRAQLASDPAWSWP